MTPLSDSERRACRGSRFWKCVNVLVAVALGIGLSEAQRAFDWAFTTLLLVSVGIALVWIPLALWSIFIWGERR